MSSPVLENILAPELILAAVSALRGPQFHATKSRPHPSIGYALHGTGDGQQLILVGRDYRPLGHNGFADYADPQFDHLRCEDKPEVRALATCINENASSGHRKGGVRVPLLIILAPDDTRDSYCRRIRALLKVWR